MAIRSVRSRLARAGFITLIALTAGLPARTFEPHCHPQILLCTTVSGCFRQATSLPNVDELQRIDSEGWTLATRCGFTTSGVACGKYLGRNVCPDGATCECGPGHPPCETGGGVVELSSLATWAAAPAVADFDGVGEYEKGSGTAEAAPETELIRERLTRMRSRLPSPLAELWQRLAGAESVYLRATAEVRRVGREGNDARAVTGEGTYEYWEQGDRYRASVDLPASLGMVRVAEFAHDGVLRQMLFSDSQMITLSRRDSRMMSVPLLNPLFLPLSFLLPPDDACPRCELRLADLRTATPVRGRALDAPGGVVRFADDAVHDVSLSAAGEVVALESRGAGGRLLRRMVFTDHQPVRGWTARFPRTVVVEFIAAEGDEAPELVATYRIEELALDRPLERSVFQIGWERAERVWDDERQSFVKQPGGRPARPREKLPN